jgi:hypothetical protein
MQAQLASVADQLDQWGKPAWIALMVVSFIVFWPIGLAILAFLIWSGRMSCGHRKWGNGERWGAWRNRASGFTPTGNRAFDEYRETTLRKLEEEASHFGAFLEKLRFAKDQEEFDRFMADRAKQAKDAGSAGQPA